MHVFFSKYRGVVTVNRDGRERNYKKRANGGLGVRRSRRVAEVKASRREEVVGCDHTSTKAPDPIRAPKLSVLR